jgi:hypothetical protein
MLINRDEVELQPNGFLNVLANLTRTGILVYSRAEPDGTISTLRQLRLPDEVFSSESLATLLGLPVTNTHPKELVTPENASDFIVGMSSDKPKKVYAPVGNTDDEDDKEEFVQQQITLFDSDTIEEVMDGEKTELSLGYTLELDETPGVYKGQNYDVIQRNIRYNHISLVKRGRAGRNCKVLLDDKETVVQLDGETLHDDDGSNINDDNKGEDMKIFKYGSKEFNVDDDVHALLTSLTANLDGMDDKLSSKTKEIEKLLAKCDELSDKIKTQKDEEDTEKFNQAVKDRVSLEGKAGKVLGESVALDSLSDIEVKKKVISKLRDGINLDGRSDEYINARFEICLEDAEEEASDGGDNSGDAFKKRVTENDGDDEDMLEKARKKAWDRDRELYKAKKA